jgi:flagellar basal-body rod modification protein FlgD
MSLQVNAATQTQNTEAAATAASPKTDQASTTGSASSGAGIDQLAQKETFLKLLVAQIKNQNPLNPADGVQFLSQLAQFSELEQLMQVRSELEAIRKAVEEKQTSAANPQSPAGGSSESQGTTQAAGTTPNDSGKGV